MLKRKKERRNDYRQNIILYLIDAAYIPAIPTPAAKADIPIICPAFVLPFS